MAGWFYAPTPQPQQLPPSVAPEDTASGNTNPNVGTIRQTNVVIRSLWGQESWPAQSGATVAAQLAPVQAPSAPPPYKLSSYINTLVRSHHKDYSLAFQRSVVSGVTVLNIQAPQSVPVTISNIATVRQAWPEPQWDAQAEMTVASIFATPANAPSLAPSPPAGVQAGVRSTWPPEEWRSQSESAVAAGLAPAVPPPLLVPSQAQFAALLAGGALWPRETWVSQTATHSLAWLPAPITALPAPTPHPELLLWPREQWSAQTGPIVASQLATLAQQLPPPPVAMLANILSSWPQEAWKAQGETNVAGLLAPVKPPTFLNKPPLSAVLLAQLVGSWPQESWPTQSEDNVGSLLAQTPPVINVAVPFTQNIQYIWPREDWRVQSETNVASLFAQQQVPPIFNPRSTVALQSGLVGTWPQESWPAQFAPARAGWIPPLVTAIPAPPLHIERLSWPQEQWLAQAGNTVASQLATAAEPMPAAPPQQALVSIWPQPSWPAQSSATVASQLALVFEIPFVPAPIRAESIASWPQEAWPAQRSAIIAGQLAATTVPITPVRPAAFGTLRGMWPQEDWSSQKGTRGASAFAKAPPVVPFISIPTRTQLVASWPREDWKAQSAARGAYIFANIGPPPPPPPPSRAPQPPANLGYKVTTRTFNLLEMVTRQWGGELRAPDHRIYEFSNGRAFDSTDMGQTGIYRKK